MAKAKVVLIRDTAGLLAAQNLALFDALQQCVPIIEDQLVIIVNSHTIRVAGAADLGSLDEEAKPEFERLTKALLAARKAIEKAGA
jgi:hypothetical protein